MCTNTPAPTVSVVMGVFNEAKTISNTLDSVFAQTIDDIECIVVDDGSTDDTTARVVAYGEKEHRLRLVEQEGHGGLTRALARGVDEARGVWLARIDAGVTWHPTKLARQLDFVAEHPEIGVIGCATEESNQQTGQVTVRRKPESHAAIFEALWRECPFIHPTILVRLHLVRQVGNYDSVYPCAQDYDLYFRLLFETKGHNLPDVLACRPTHGADSISLVRWKEQARCALRIRWRYFRQHAVPLLRYRHLLPTVLKLCVPSSLKMLKQRAVGRKP